MRKNAAPAPAIWLARGKNQNISAKRAMTFLSLARTWTLLAYEKDQLAAIEKEEDGGLDEAEKRTWFLFEASRAGESPRSDPTLIETD